METTTLGNTGLKVSRLGVGLAEMGALTTAQAEQAGRILGSALDAGINFFDTAECLREQRGADRPDYGPSPRRNRPGHEGRPPVHGCRWRAVDRGGGDGLHRTSA